ncbi:hypothetical protein Hrd1104_00215 [Halorhabdus sp. CBA1104]|uniref:hypothetical protein n=1 Tax=Halorhabdus sp. CBA1104 TaxID=1380432 RepID=UPI0012B2AB02|nr:hypothetical protein [Halorhabdus sp. CBA1104]QGN05867.1 hypothetical protein Hrd1104_00215 [Halorhabdus sp. CBA1104]
MSTTNFHRQKSSSRRGTDPRDNYIPLGTDADGRSHVYRTLDETIHVIDGDERTHREAIATRSVDEWMAFVEGRVGWERRRYGKGIIGLIREAFPDEELTDR